MENLNSDFKSNSRFLLWLGAGTAVWITLSFLFGYPYGLVPSEDIRYILKPFEWLHQPLFTFALESAKMLGAALQLSGVNALLLLSLGSLGATGLLVGWIVWRMTRDGLFATGASTLFLTSGWTLHYLLYGNYTVWATFLFTLLLAGLQMAGEYFERENISASSSVPQVSPELIFVSLSGILAAFLFLSSPQSPVFLLLAVGMIALIFRRLPSRGRIGVLGFFFIPMAMVVLPFALRLVPELFEHWRMNVLDNNLTLTKKEWGENLPYIFGIFWRTASLFSPLIVMVWSMVLLAVSLCGFSKRASLRRPSFWIYLGLAHVLLIEILPFTKLARTHFAGWPLVVVGLVVGLHFLEGFLGGRTRQALRFVFVLIVLGSAVQGITLIHSAEHQKREGLRILEPVLRGTQLYVLASDPHASVIQPWLGLNLPTVTKLSEIKKEAGKRVGILLGPHGPGSGFSGLRASLLRDFYPERLGIVPPKGAVETLLPFHAYFPTFLMEEEVSQALYFLNRAPDYRKPELQLTLWTWE